MYPMESVFIYVARNTAPIKTEPSLSNRLVGHVSWVIISHLRYVRHETCERFLEWLFCFCCITAQKMKFSIKDFFSKCDKQIWSHLLKSLTLSWRRPLSYRNQSMDWFLYDKGLRHERVNGKLYFLYSVSYW